MEYFLTENKNHPLIKDIIQGLIRYVPFRFIRPWFEEINGVKDGLVNQEIIKLQVSKKNDIPYFIDLPKNQIIINDNWFSWINSNIKIIESYTLYELFKYVEKNNPYVTNLSIKLFKPQTRKLTVPTKLWIDFINSKGPEFNSVFEMKPLISLEKMAIDHYLPWSLVTHDKLWNLHPIEQDVNSSKSNKIADMKYLNDFAKLQYNFIQHISSSNTKHLEDYFTLFSISKLELLSFSNDMFTELLSSKINVEIDLAKNLGYFTKWSHLIHR